jgi:hypothetical protein
LSEKENWKDMFSSWTDKVLPWFDWARWYIESNKDSSYDSEMSVREYSEKEVHFFKVLKVTDTDFCKKKLLIELQQCQIMMVKSNLNFMKKKIKIWKKPKQKSLFIKSE